jgi:hypothetical protein
MTTSRGTSITSLSDISEPFLVLGGKSFAMLFEGAVTLFESRDPDSPFRLYEGILLLSFDI